MNDNAPDEEQGEIKLIELSAAVGYIARERAGDIPLMLWAIFQSKELMALITAKAPEAHRYASLAEVDEAVYYILTASEEGRILQQAGERSTPASRRRERMERQQREEARVNLERFMEDANLFDPSKCALCSELFDEERTPIERSIGDKKIFLCPDCIDRFDRGGSSGGKGGGGISRPLSPPFGIVE